MARHKGLSLGWGPFLVSLVLVFAVSSVCGLHFPDANSQSSYARYPKWNACPDASLSFEFQTSQPEGMLLYTDSRGGFDFLQVMTKSGRVNVLMNIVDEDVRLELDAGRDVTDRRWHTVEIRRNRMSTTLTVDDVSDSGTTHGSDFQFGNLETNNDVFLGGLPDTYNNIDALHKLSLASALFEPRFSGSIRNIIYGNCSCGTVRAEFVEGAGMTLSPPEACTERNPCRNGCTCVSKDEGPACDCSQLDCLIIERNDDTHYILPMDTITGTSIENPSGLDATAYGSPTLIPGVKGNAIRLHTPEQYIRVSGPSHRHECFGDLDKCPHGYTLSFWVNFEHPVDGEEIFLSNGGHTDRSYGVAMLYNSGKLEFRFRRKNAESWHVEHMDVLPNHWYHVAATWGQHEGLSLYIDGILVDTDTRPQIRGSVTSDQRKFDSFILGRSNEEGQRRTRRATTHSSVAMDEFHFSSSHMSREQAREMGPIFRYYFPMEVLDGNQLPDGRTAATIHGNPSLIRGKVGRALRLDGRMEYVDAGDVRNACLGDLQRCTYGISVAFWINSFHVQDNMYYLDSGNKGLKVYYKEGKLIAEFQQGNRHWNVEWDDFKRNKWYFIELSWNQNDGARMYANLVQVAHDATPMMKSARGGTSQFYIGRANTAMDPANEKYAQAYIDEVEVLYADRAKCLQLGLIQRDTIQHILIPFENQHDNEIIDQNYRIIVYNGARLIPGKVGKGVFMNASSQHQQWTSLGELQQDCLGNLALCTHGLTIKMQIFPKDLQKYNHQYYMSAGPYSLYYKNGRLYAKFTNGTKTWTVSTSFFSANKWQEVELTWHAQRGLQMYIDGRQMGSTSVPSTHAEMEITDWTVYLGRPNTMITKDDKVGRGNAIIDEMELWFAHKDFIGMWPKHVRHDIIDMDRIISRNRVEHTRHEGHHVYAMNNPAVVRGWINDAISLDGNGQYINGGPNCSCRGNLQRCYNGFTLRSRIKPNQLQEGMYLFSSAAYDIYYRRGKIVASFRTPTHKWFVQSDRFSMSDWSLMEWTWHPTKGLQMYVNGKEVATDRSSSPYTGQYNTGKNFYVGRSNLGTNTNHYGRFTVDDVQLWEAYREILINNGLIDPNERKPGDVRKDIIDMDRIVGNRVSHDKHRGHNVFVYNQPSGVHGWIKGAIKLNGNNQYINVGQNSSCGGELENCPHGFTLRSRVRGDNLRNGQFLYASNMYDVYYRNGKLWCQFKTPTKTWTVSTQSFNPKDWNLMEFTWHGTKGLKMYMNNREVASDNSPVSNTDGYNYNEPLYIGRANTDMSLERYGQFTVDDVQLWEAWRQYLIEDGLVDPSTDPPAPPTDVKKDIIDMDGTLGNTVIHENAHRGHKVYTFNRPSTVQGWINNGIGLNGINQYIKVGANSSCNGNLENCPQGFTLRSRIKPKNLVDNMYIHSSAQYDIYYRDNKVWAEFHTPEYTWKVSSGQFRDLDWNLMEWTWHPEHGLIMYVNNREVARSTTKIPISQKYDYNKVYYIGRANTDMRFEKYGQFVIDDVQLWEAWRQYLLDEDLIDPSTDPKRPVTVTPPPPTTTTTTTTTPAPESYMLFDGTNWILYNMAGVPEEQRMKSDSEEIMIEFRTTEPNGLIWWAGMEDRNMHLSLKNGQVLLVCDYGGGKVDRFRVAKTQGRLSDGEWHKVIITRNGKNVVVDIDGLEVDRTLSHEPSIVTDGAILIGGYVNPRTITGKKVNHNLDGYVKQMHVETDHITRMDLFQLFEESPRQYWVVPNGLLPENAKSRPKPVTFQRRGAYIRLPKYEGAHEGVIDFKFRTTEPNGLLMYNGGPQGVQDFFSVELYDGVMYYIINTGRGVYRVPFSESMVNDGNPHHAKIERSNNDLILYMDGKQLQYRVAGLGNEPLDLDSFLYIGAVDVASSLPWHLWTRREKYYLGCLWDLEINNARPADLETYVTEQRVTGIDTGCDEKVAMCLHNPCAHGRCIDTWGGAVCNCAGTVYNGERCEHFADVVTFDGTDFLRINIKPMTQTHTDDISLRFKTGKENGLLFATDNHINHAYIKALIENGHGKLRTNLGGREQVIEFGRHLADDEWHTLYIKRRANELDVWVDDNDKFTTLLPGSGWTLDIDMLMVAAMGEDDAAGMFAGWMQNFYLGKTAIMDIENLPPGWKTDGNITVGPTGKPIPEHAVTLTHPMDSYATLATLEAVEDMEVSFMFKTNDANGLLMYNGGNGNQFIAVELVGGYVHLVLNDGGETRIYKATSERLNDNGWHFVKIKRVGYAFTVMVDQASAFFSGRTKREGDRVDLTGPLYVGGMPRNLYNHLPFEVQSRRGFRGCLASIKIGGRMYNLLEDSVFVSTYIKQNCTSTGIYCFANPCKNHGICLDGVSTYICDCNMTAYVGRICTDEPEGYRYGVKYRPGFYAYNYDGAWSSKKDSLALGFMTWYENGTIARIESDRSADYIEIKMINGHVVVEYNVGGGVHRLVEDRQKFNDGKYHVVVFERSEENATFRVDSYPTHRFYSAGNTGVKLFNEVMRVNVGGIQAYMDDRRQANKAFNGIIAGLYFNGLRVLDSGIVHHSIHGVTHGDVTIADHRFYLQKPSPPTALPPDGTDKPNGGGVVTNPPPVYTPTEVPLENSGGGAVWGSTHGGEGSSSIVQPGGGGAGAVNVGNGPLAQPVVSPFIVGGPAEGGRAAAFAGTFIGALLLASSLVYALYKLKPGQLACLGAGGGGKGGPVISSPTARATTNYQLVGSGSAGAGAGAVTKVEVANGAAATGTGVSMSSFGTQTLEHGASAGGATSQTQAFADYFSSIQQTNTSSMAVGQANGAGGGGSYGTMTRAIQTDYQQADAGQALANNYDQQTLNQQQQFSSYHQESNSYSALDSYQTSSSYMQQNTLQNDQSGAWQMHTMAPGSGAQNLATLAAEEIRVDCLLMTSDGQHVVTGSIYGPPQAWDLSSGELVRIMSGEELSSTDLHLACKDTLLVGQVAEMTQVDPGDPQATSRIHNRKLQIWDFLTGRPLEMEKNELCTASCMMADEERIVLGRTEKFGGGTTIVIYDLLANEPVRTLRYEAAVGFADYISYLNLSKDNRYVIAGFQNSYDGNANFIIFDLTADSYSNAVEPKLLALDACAECTAVLDNHEAVTGTRNGELLIWSMRTGKPLRQLVSATGGTTMTRMGVSKSVAHAKEVKAVSVSRDGKLLVSASSDCTLKVWNLESERQITTLKGHTDEIWCCTISNDNDIVVSGSRDGTIRLWRLSTATPICVYNTGVDVFSVRMSSNKRTIVALGDKFGARKLIMLRVVITKTRSRAPSRATSPIHMGSRPTSPYRATSPLIR